MDDRVRRVLLHAAPHRRRVGEVFDGRRGGYAEDSPPNPVNRYDTSLDASATAAALGVELPDLDTQLRRLERSLTCMT